MKKLCCIFNTPSLYREPIYRLIDQSYECDWFFEDTDNKVKTFDTGIFRSVRFLHSISLGPFFWVKGLLSLLRSKEYTDYFVTGQSRNLSVFIFLLLNKVFRYNKKVYLWSHGLYGKETKMEHLWKMWMFKMADELFIYGDYACGLMKDAGISTQKLHPIHNSLAYDLQLNLRSQMKATDVYSSHFGNSNPVIVFIGRLTAVKRLDMLIEAIEGLAKQGSNYNLVFIGDGTEKDNLQGLSERLGVAKQVWFYGACYDEKLNAELVYNADLCVAPGNIGLTAMHVLMFGCPAITHNNFAHQMPEFEAIKPNKTGAFFEMGSKLSLMQTIDSWFKNHSASREEVRRNCYEVIDNEWNTHYQIKMIKEVIK